MSGPAPLVRGRLALDLVAVAARLARHGVSASVDDVAAALAASGFRRKWPSDLGRTVARIAARAQFVRAARLGDAPRLVDCSSFVRYLFSREGIWVPRRSAQLVELGQSAFGGPYRPLDVFIATGRKNYLARSGALVGHVAVAVNGETLAHASGPLAGVVVQSIAEFARTRAVVDVRRIYPRENLAVYAAPPPRDVETDDDAFWIVYQALVPNGAVGGR